MQGTAASHRNLLGTPAAVQVLAVQYANGGLKHAACELQHLVKEIEAAALLHDAGKLTDDNQAILRGEVKSNHLIKHEDAGFFVGKDQRVQVRAAVGCTPTTWALQSRAAEVSKLLDEPAGVPYRFTGMLGISEQNLPTIQQRFLEMGLTIPSPATCSVSALSGFSQRFALSCLVDADHTDTAIWQGAPPKTQTPTRWAERLHKLEEYVATLPVTEQSSIRQALFHACKSAAIQGRVNLDAVVGSGKTLASMVYALRTAIDDRIAAHPRGGSRIVRSLFRP